MGESMDDGAGVGGSFDVDGLKKKPRRQDTGSKPRNALAAIEREILEEIACQSGRYGERLDTLLGELATLRQTIEPGMTALCQDQRADAEASLVLNGRIAAYNRLRAQAQQVQHYLIIHREAMGFWNHDDVYRCYPIPTAFTPLPPDHIPAPPAPP
jgi:hypothetical protein